MPAPKAKVVRAYVDSLEGQLILHFLPGYALGLNSDELAWSYAKCTGVACSLLRGGEKLMYRVRQNWPKSLPDLTVFDRFSGTHLPPVFLTSK